jgi:hypothetical protein
LITIFYLAVFEVIFVKVFILITIFYLAVFEVIFVKVFISVAAILR